MFVYLKASLFLFLTVGMLMEQSWLANINKFLSVLGP